MRNNIHRSNYFNQYPEALEYKYVNINDIEPGTLVLSALNEAVYYLVSVVYDFKTNAEVKVLICLDNGAMHNASTDDMYIPVFSQVAVGEPMPLPSVIRQKEIDDIKRTINKYEDKIDSLVGKLRTLKGGDV